MYSLRQNEGSVELRPTLDNLVEAINPRTGDTITDPHTGEPIIKDGEFLFRTSFSHNGSSPSLTIRREKVSSALHDSQDNLQNLMARVEEQQKYGWVGS